MKGLQGNSFDIREQRSSISDRNAGGLNSAVHVLTDEDARQVTNMSTMEPADDLPLLVDMSVNQR